MKKFQHLLKDKDISKHPDFLQILRIYKACLKHFNKSKALKKKAKEKHLALKKKKAASKEQLHAAKCSRIMAKNYKSMWRKLLKTSAYHVEQWVKIYSECGIHSNTSKSTITETAKKRKTDKPAAKPAVEKVNKPKPAKQKTSKQVAAPKLTVKTEAKAKPVKASKAPAPARVIVAKKPTPKPIAVKKPVAEKAPLVESNAKDDLKKIEGVGPKIEALLNADGLHSFAHVSKSSVEKLQGILDKAGPRYSLARPASWPQQAKLAASGKWEELKKWQAELKGGQGKK